MRDTEEDDLKHNLAGGLKVIGLKQVMKHGQQKELKEIYLATDADYIVREQVLSMADENQIPVLTVSSKRKLGKICGIDVSAACAGILGESAD